MDQLRGLFEELGFANVETFIASGNVIFDSKTTNTKSLERKIEKHLEKSLGYEVATFVRSVSELALIARHEPFASKELNADGNTFVCLFRQRPANNQGDRETVIVCLEYPTDFMSTSVRCIGSIAGITVNQNSMGATGESAGNADDRPECEYSSKAG
jgi:uncharacterized protein (DUF1697 family)